MKNYLSSKTHYDLVTPDGHIDHIKLLDEKNADITVIIKNISSAFVGFYVDPSKIFFNLKSTLAQLGFNSTTVDFHLSKKNKEAEVKIKLIAITPLSEKMLSLLTTDMFIGKLFAIDDSRRVRDPNYLMRMFGRCDRM